jgi:hypothetical protein
MWARLQDYVLREWRVIQRAPWAFGACLAVGLVLMGLGMWGAFSWAYGSILSQKDATIESQRSRIDGLETTVRELRSSSPRSPAPIARDPDGIYQLDAQVGSVQSPEVDESKGITTFAAIIAATKLNIERDFVYRDFVLHIKSFGTASRSNISGQVNRAFGQVVCEIVGRVSHQ